MLRRRLPCAAREVGFQLLDRDGLPELNGSFRVLHEGPVGAVTSGWVGVRS